MSDKFIFLYDKLMTKAEQEKTLIKAELISCGVMPGKMYWVVNYRFNRRRHTRIYASYDESTSKLIYGGIFLIKDYEFQMRKIHAYYNNSIMQTGKTIREDLFDYADANIRPIKFSSISDLTKCKYEIGKSIKCGVFLGNISNERIRYNTKDRDRYYKANRIDKKNFIQMLKDNTNVKEY